MFGSNDNTQAMMGSPTVQNPSMLDNVSPQDFQTSDPQQPQSTPTPVADDSMPAHSLTTDNPFVQDAMPVSAPVMPAPEVELPQVATAAPAPEPVIMGVSTPSDSSTATSPSAPVAPPVVAEESASENDNSSYVEALANDTMPTATASVIEPVDHEKLADMKREALEQLEPLADHIDGTPEDTFKTTMMMIQANDNHTLLEKALDAAKKIEDDKMRAQAMLDIINEINYFSQAQ